MKWEIVNNQLERNFEFKTQSEAVEFILKIARHSDKINHHADFYIYNVNKLRIRIFTHFKNQITEKDHALAQFINEYFLER